MRFVAFLVALAVVALLPLMPVAVRAAGEYEVVTQDGVPAGTTRAVAAELDRCYPYVSTALKIPAPHTKVYLYATQEAFVRGLQEIGRMSAPTAVRSGRQFTYVASNSAIFLFGPRVQTRTPYDQAYNTCMIVALTFQGYLMTPQHATVPHWLRQGHGWMMGQQAAESFGVDSASARQERDTRGLREMRDRTGFPRLSSIDTVEGMQDAFDRYTPANVSYFLRQAGMFLAAKSSQEAFGVYFKGVATHGGRPPESAAVFRSAFGTTPEQFQSQFDDYLADLVK